MDIRIEDINHINSSTENIIRKVDDYISKTPGTMNIVEIMNRHRLENQHSDIISFLINPKEKHHHNEFGKMFLQSLNKTKFCLTNFEIKSVYREFPTDKHRRMDIFIETKTDYIIIENKLCTGDRKNQISDYIKYIEGKYLKTVKPFLIYLTVDGKAPKEHSISKIELDILKKEKRCVFLSYKDILEWVKTLIPRAEEIELKAALNQYIDVLNGLTGNRKETFSMEQGIINELMTEYLKDKSINKCRDNLAEVLKNVHIWQENIKTIVYMNFFEAIYEKLSVQHIESVKLYCSGAVYTDISIWEKEVLNRLSNYGIKYSFHNGTDNFTKSLILKDIKSEKLIYGILKNEIVSIKNINCYKLDKQKDINDTDYALAQKITPWFSDALFKRSTWEEKENISIVEHVVHDWFLNC